jgi:hypothetical protein
VVIVAMRGMKMEKMARIVVFAPVVRLIKGWWSGRWRG